MVTDRKRLPIFNHDTSWGNILNSFYLTQSQITKHVFFYRIKKTTITCLKYSVMDNIYIFQQLKKKFIWSTEYTKSKKYVFEFVKINEWVEFDRLEIFENAFRTM